MPGKRQRDHAPKAVEDASENPKRRRPFTLQDEKLAQIYDKLADDNPDIRLNAAKELLEELTTDRLSSELIEKVLQRLIRGLCSSRKFARHGYFIALTEFLRQTYKQDSKYSSSPPISKLELILLVTSSTQISNKAPSQVT